MEAVRRAAECGERQKIRSEDVEHSRALPKEILEPAAVERSILPNTEHLITSSWK
jgi:hypothetical protein